MAAHARLKKEFTEDETYHNLMTLKFGLCFTVLEDFFTDFKPTVRKSPIGGTKAKDIREKHLPIRKQKLAVSHMP